MVWEKNKRERILVNSCHSEVDSEWYGKGIKERGHWLTLVIVRWTVDGMGKE